MNQCGCVSADKFTENKFPARQISVGLVAVQSCSILFCLFIVNVSEQDRAETGVWTH